MKVLKTLRNKYFLKPDGSNANEFKEQFQNCLDEFVKGMGKGPIYPILSKEDFKVSKIINSSLLETNINTNPSKILKEIPKQVQGSVKAGHPFMVKNIIPTASLPSLVSHTIASTLMGNGVTGEDAALTIYSELAVAAFISQLVGVNPNHSAAVMTFGGTATNLYGMKIGLYKADPSHGEKGINQKVVCIESVPSHYCHATGANWLGIGTDNLVRVNANSDQTTNYQELEAAVHSALQQKKKIVCINVLAGTTSNLGIDNIKKVFTLRNKVVKQYKLDYTPHIHADAVLGWAFLVFRYYDFDKNELGFEQPTLKQIKKILNRIVTLKYADSFGVDFHKTGYVAYPSSMIFVKDKNDFKLLRREGEIMTPLFHDDSVYNPGKYTLETSRSSANALSAWVAMKTFGIQGYQALLGHAIEMGLYYRKLVEANTKHGLYIANQQHFGPDVFIRCYPPQLNPKETYNQEMGDNQLLESNSNYVTKFANWMNEKEVDKHDNGFAISRSSAAIYTKTGQPMVALRIYPLSPYIEEHHARTLIKRLIKQKTEFDKLFFNDGD